MIDAAPPVRSAEEVDGGRGYACPLCKVQSTSDAVDTGWVRCPLIEDRALCYGCCLDHQSAARAVDFTRFEYCSLFEETSAETGRGVVELRRACLGHQEALVLDELRGDASEGASQVELLTRIRIALAAAER